MRVLAGPTYNAIAQKHWDCLSYMVGHVAGRAKPGEVQARTDTKIDISPAATSVLGI